MIAFKKHLTPIIMITILAALFTGCGSQSAQKDPAPSSKQPASFKVGVTPGPHAQIMEVVKKEAEKQGLDIKVMEFNDYIQLNVALNQGDIDANSFQHKPYLDQIVKDRNYDLVSVAKTAIFPMAIYSKKIKNLKELPNNTVVAIPNDPTNGSRALLLLQREGVIKLKPGNDVKVTVADIAGNPKNIKVKELDAAIIPRSLDDVDAAAINTNYAMSAGLSPKKDSLAIEDASSPYANIIAVRGKDKDSERTKQFIKIYQSDAVKKFIQDQFGESVAPAW